MQPYTCQADAGQAPDWTISNLHAGSLSEAKHKTTDTKRQADKKEAHQ